MLPEHEQRALRAAWTIEPAPDGLADRVIRHALAQPQRQSWFLRVRSLLTRQEHAGAWTGGFVLAACLLIAVIATDGAAPAAGGAYTKPLDQIAEEILWDDYAT